MIQVLQHQQEVEAATQTLQQQNLPTHITVQKNWDQWRPAQILQQRSVLDRQPKVLDLGSGDRKSTGIRA